MQLVPRYLLSNTTALVINEAGFITEFRPVYSRHLQVYRGIENVLQFRLMNADQRPVDTSQYVPRLVAFDQENRMIFDKTGTVLDNGLTSTKGLFTVSLTERDLFDVEQQYLKYNVYLVDQENHKTLTYSHSNFDNNSTMYVTSDAFPSPKPSTEVVTFNKLSYNTDIWLSEGVNTNTILANQDELHTVAVYNSGYSSSITIQASLDNSLTEGTIWSDVHTMLLTGNEEEPIAINLIGAYTFIRFKLDSDPLDKLSKILVRS